MPQTAWVATAMITAFRGDSDAALGAGQRAFVAAEARGDDKMVLASLFIQSSAFSALGDFDRAKGVANEALRRAKLYGHPTMITAAVVTAAGLYSEKLAEPDFGTCLETLTRERVNPAGGDVGAMWLDLTEAAGRLGLHRPGAVECYGRAARTADRLNAQHAFDSALRGLALIAAEAGLAEPAQALVAYAQANLSAYRVNSPGQIWMASRLDGALATLPEPRHSSEPALHRGDILKLIADLEATLTRDEPSS